MLKILIIIIYSLIIKGVNMIFIYVILAFIALLLIIALFVSKNIDYEKSIKIDSNIDKVWENVSSLSAMDKWSPWKDKDPEMIQTITGN